MRGTPDECSKRRCVQKKTAAAVSGCHPAQALVVGTARPRRVCDIHAGPALREPHAPLFAGLPAISMRKTTMFHNVNRLSGVGSVTRPDGIIVEDVAYEISLHTRWYVRTGTASGRLRVQRNEAMYWFLEIGNGLRLTVTDGRRLLFGLNGAPDHSGWVEISAAAVGR